jgi:hypothetical protein
MFGENIGQSTPAAPAGLCGRNLRPQTRELLPRQLKHEVSRKSMEIALDLLVQPFGLDAVELRKVRI